MKSSMHSWLVKTVLRDPQVGKRSTARQHFEPEVERQVVPLRIGKVRPKLRMVSVSPG